MCITVEQAKELAICYHAFAEAKHEDWKAKYVWGKMLLDIQRETGVEMYEQWLIKSVINTADNILHAKAA